MRLRLRAGAVRDVEGIFDYSVAMHGTAAAETYALSLDATMQRLLDYPELGVKRDDVRPGLRSLPSGEYRIFYRVEGLEIVVARVLHKAMDEARYL